MNNKDRVKKIESILGLMGEESKDKYYRVADVLCDLKHFCDTKSINFYDEMDMSEIFYNSEKELKNE
jgi:hypothetical protein